MTNFEALIGLNKIEGLGSIRLSALLNYFDKPQNILSAPQGKLSAISGIGPKIAASICSLKKEDIDKELDLAKSYNLKILTLDDEGYPENLRQIPGPPIVLYIKGELKKEDKLSLAIVGSRRVTFYGLTCAEKFAAELSDFGFTIVSGMASGIDTYAHRGALSRNNRTIAVMGSGFKHIYPTENRELAEEISKTGAVISEFPIQTLPLRQNFPRRNRVISGLSLGVLVVEAAQNSGALITADFALEQGRDVFALPGKIDSGNSFGTNGLIKQGAKLVSCLDDILEEFDLFMTQPKPKPKQEQEQEQEQVRRHIKEALQKDDTSGIIEESFLYDFISCEPVSLDELVEKTELSVPEVTKMLFNLQMRRLIKQLPGKQFIRSNDG